MIRRLVLVVTLTAVLAACGSSNDSSTETDAATEAGVVGAITVSAAASLTEAFERIGGEFEQTNPGATVTFNFDSSTTLAQQALDGLQVDAFASADVANMTRLADADMIIGSPQTIASNKLMIVVKPGNPLNIQTLADLNNAAVVALCGDTVPCGAFAGQALTKANVDIAEDRITRGQNAKATLAAVSEGDADAGIVYVTDVQAAGAAVSGIPIAAEVNIVADYPMAVLTDTINRPLADAFVAFVLGAQGQAALAQAGFAAT